MSALGPAGLFTGVAIALLLGDLLLLRRRAERLSFAEAMARTAFFVACACAIALVLGFASPDTLASLGLRPETISRGTGAQEFIQAYLVELTLSVDNVLVIALIVGHFGLSPLAQHRVLFWGVISAFVMRGALILVGAAALTRFEWMTYVFGVVLLWSAVRLLRSPTVTYDPNEGRIVAWATRLFDIPVEEKSDRLFVRRKGRWALSALVLPLLAIEATDLVFAFDSIPAVLAVTNDATIAYTSNLTAVLGMRSLYFLVVPLLARLRHLQTSLVLVLAFIGLKMLLEHSRPIPSDVSFYVTSSLIALGILASLIDSTPRPTPATNTATRTRRLTPLNLRSAKRAVVLVVGSTAMLLGAVFAVISAPGVLVLVGALTLLATEFAWARLWLRRVRKALRAVQTRAKVGGP